MNGWDYSRAQAWMGVLGDIWQKEDDERQEAGIPVLVYDPKYEGTKLTPEQIAEVEARAAAGRESRRAAAGREGRSRTQGAAAGSGHDRGQHLTGCGTAGHHPPDVLRPDAETRH